MDRDRDGNDRSDRANEEHCGWWWSAVGGSSLTKPLKDIWCAGIDDIQQVEWRFITRDSDCEPE